jgi:hypothetical protein
MAILMKPARSMDWTKERIDALQTPEVKQLRANAERLNDPEIVERCDAVLADRPRGGGPGSVKPPKSTTTRVRKKKAAPAPETTDEAA